MNQELFGITPPKKLFVKLAIPSLISMLFSSIYMMTDGMFVGKVIGSKALAAYKSCLSNYNDSICSWRYDSSRSICKNRN